MENKTSSRPSISASPDTTYIPRLVEGLDTSRFAFDPLTIQLMKLIDGKKPAAQIAVALGTERQDVLDRLSALETAQLVQVTAEMIDHATSYTPPPPTPARAPAVAPAPHPDLEETQPVHAIERNHVPAVEAVTPLDTVGPAPVKVDGVLDTGRAKQIIDEAIADKFSGSLVFSAWEHEVIVHFVGGDPEGVQSSFDSHEHGLLLFSNQKIDRATYDRYEAALRTGAARHPVAALKEAGVTDRKELGELVYQRGRLILQELARWQEGTFVKKFDTIFPTTIARCSLMPMAPGKTATPAAQKKAPGAGRVAWREIYLTDEQQAFLKERIPQYMAINEEMAQAIVSLSLTRREKEYVKSLVEKPMQVSFAMAISPLPRTITRRLLVQLLKLGVFDLSETNPDGISEILPDELGDYLGNMKSKHAFDIIAAHASSTQAEIESRYQKTLALFDDRFYTSINPAQRAELTEIRRRIQEAGTKLIDKATRRRIREQVWDRVQLANFYDIQVKKARIALQMRRDANAAFLLASSALEIKPHGAEATELLNGARQLKRDRPQTDR